MPAISRYKKLRNLLHEKIVSGRYAVGDRFLSQNELIKRYSLSFSTVNRALDELVREGFLTREIGRGTFVRATHPNIAAASAETKNMFVFVPVTGTRHPLVDAATLYQQLETLRPDNVSIRIIPHTTGADDLDFFLFSREQIHLAVFLNPEDSQIPFRDMLSKHCPVITLVDSGLTKSNGTLFIDYASTTADAVAYLIAQGHSRIGVICDNKRLQITTDCIVAYKSALRAASLEYLDTLVIFLPENVENTTHILETDSFDYGATAYVVLIPGYTESIISQIQATGLRIPQDVSIIGLDTSGQSLKTSPTFSCIEVSSVAIAEKLLDILGKVSSSELIHDHLKSRLVIRESTAPRLTSM